MCFINAKIFKKHLLEISLILSLLLHLLFCLTYGLIDTLQFSGSSIDEPLKDQRSDEQRIEFELVETPEEARSEKPPENAHLLSDKNAIARDQYQNQDKPEGNPYLDGDLDVKNLPLEHIAPTPSMAQRPDRSNEVYQNDQLNRSKSQKYEYQKFSREQLLKTNPSHSGQEQSRVDRPLYNNQKFSAKELGGFSFNTYNWDFAPYLLEMKKKVERNVFPPPAFTHMGLISGETLLRFKVMPDGAVKDLTVLQYTGHESLKETSVRAILNSSPFKPLPADFPEDHLEVTASFTYYVRR